MSKNTGKGRAGTPVMPMSEYTSVNVEKISNGYLVRTSSRKGDKWNETTEYHAQKPKVSIPVVPARKGGK